MNVNGVLVAITHDHEVKKEEGVYEKMLFVDVMVLFAELIIKALGEHWLHNERFAKNVVPESNNEVFKDRNRKIKDILENNIVLSTLKMHCALFST